MQGSPALVPHSSTCRLYLVLVSRLTHPHPYFPSLFLALSPICRFHSQSPTRHLNGIRLRQRHSTTSINLALPLGHFISHLGSHEHGDTFLFIVLVNPTTCDWLSQPRLEGHRRQHAG